ncbi:MAG TPA: response regulator [Candidatus Paceibacterota bacterium]|nr:response regulator [Candidatus Paceibacterota bacterium]
MIGGNSVVLVVEDERPLAEAISLKLKKNNFDVVSARSVEQALDYLNGSVAIDAIWLDHYLLGKENGLDLVMTLKGSEGKWKGIPIFVVSNTAGPDKVQSYIRLGVNKYFVKAENRLDDIITEIKKALVNPSE